MNVVIPPLFFYVIGALLVIFGALRAVTLGRRKDSHELAEDSPQQAKARRRHVTFGIVWIVMGLFLIVSTADVLRMRH
ncbi:MAG TPA: hypothetical protein VN962_25525 [Polyangia bacterium]|nr:hypothetical protein [Polyangia bacterium]